MKRSEIKRKTPLGLGEKTMRKSPLKSGAKPLKRTAMTREPSDKKKAYEAELDALTPALLRRSKGHCEARIPRVCTGKGEHRHHRKLGRGKGTQDSVEALMNLCNACHDHIHRTMPRETAETLGYIVKNSVDPVSVPVVTLRRLT